MTQKTISIIGCGWLGLALAHQLHLLGFVVKGSTKTSTKLTKLQQLGIKPYLLDFEPNLETENDINDFFFSDTLIICLTPQEAKRGANFHSQQIQAILNCIPTHHKPQIIYTSSTSIYPENQQVVDENSETLAHIAVAQAENILQEKFKNSLTIFRLAGLMGYERIPAKYFAGKKGLDTAEIPVNYVHRDDVIQIIIQIIQQNVWGEIFNVVAPKHPHRREVYQKNCDEFGFEMPEFVANPNPQYKIVSSEKLIQELDYQFKYANPLDFYYELNKDVSS